MKPKPRRGQSPQTTRAGGCVASLLKPLHRARWPAGPGVAPGLVPASARSGLAAPTFLQTEQVTRPF